MQMENINENPFIYKSLDVKKCKCTSNSFENLVNLNEYAKHNNTMPTKEN